MLRALSILLAVLLLAAVPCAAQERGPLRYCFSEWLPFSFLDQDGNPQGLYNDMVAEIFEKQLGLKVKYLQVPWKRAQYNIEYGRADFIITVNSEKRTKYSLASKLPLLRLYLHAFTYNDHPQMEEIQTITSGKDIKDYGLTPVTNIGNHWHKENIDSYGTATHYVNNEENAFMILANKRADITIEPIYAGAYLIKKLGLADTLTATRARFGPINMHLLFSKRSPHIDLFPEIDKAIQAGIDNGTLERIAAEYEKVK